MPLKLMPLPIGPRFESNDAIRSEFLWCDQLHIGEQHDKIFLFSIGLNLLQITIGYGIFHKWVKSFWNFDANVIGFSSRFSACLWNFPPFLLDFTAHLLYFSDETDICNGFCTKHSRCTLTVHNFRKQWFCRRIREDENMLLAASDVLKFWSWEEYEIVHLAHFFIRVVFLLYGLR